MGLPRMVNHTFGAGNVNTVTTAGIDTSGANFLVAIVTGGNSPAPGTLSDSKSNTWTALTARALSGQSKVQIFYATNPTVGSAHTFTVGSVSGSAPAITVMAFAGMVTSSPFDVENGNTINASGQSSITTGSITPSQDNELIIWGHSSSSAALPITVASFVGMAGMVALVGGNNYANAAGYGVQGTAAAVNLTLTLPGTNFPTAAIASFKAA